MVHGSCLCGNIRFEVSGPIPGGSICHCGQCRKQSGHLWASAHVPREALAIHGETLKWFRSSETAQRGFCGTCGSFLFWSHDKEDAISFALGALDPPTGTRIEKHIFTADQGDYYDIQDGLPQS